MSASVLVSFPSAAGSGRTALASSQLISTALYLRRRLALAAAIAITPLLYFMLAKNRASLNYTALLTILVLIGLAIQLDVGVLGVIPRLRAESASFNASISSAPSCD